MAAHGGQAKESTPLQAPQARNAASIYATVKLMGIGGIGLIADGYDLNVINLGIALMKQLYPDRMGPAAKSFAGSMALAGVIVGQLGFGAIADITGRKAAALCTSVLMIVGAVMSACVTDSPHVSIAVKLGIFRFILGLGIGGEYPLSAAITQESGTGGEGLCFNRAQMLTINMLLFNVGSLVQAVFVLAMIWSGMSLSLAWRLAFAGGCIPACIALTLRLRMEEPGAGAAGAAGAQRSYLSNVWQVLQQKWTVLVGVCLSWFLFNWTAYGHSTFASSICEHMLGDAGDSPHKLVFRDAIFAVITACVGVAGNLLGFFLEPMLTRRTMQMCGFFAMAVCLLASSLMWGGTHRGHLSLVYLLCILAVPIVGITTYLVPTESFPALTRTTAVGVAAASGKLGGLAGTAVFPIISAKWGFTSVMSISSFVSLLGVAVTFLFIPGQDHYGITKSLGEDKL
mmetsp:Transcript_58487/g.165206  ORF Transcript_58487/g.165206 Transcript_58487/m.165206 type:complete len:456 (-) Transcript_58487:62-1429(-)